MHGVLGAWINARNSFTSQIFQTLLLVASAVVIQKQIGKNKVVPDFFLTFKSHNSHSLLKLCSNWGMCPNRGKTKPVNGTTPIKVCPHYTGYQRSCCSRINDKKLNRCGNPPDPPTSMLGHSVSMPLPTMASGYPPYLNSGLNTSATPSGSPSPSLLLLSVPLLNIDWPTKRTRVSSFTSPDSLQILTGRVWNPILQQEFGEDLCKLLIATRSCQGTNNQSNIMVRLASVTVTLYST